MKDSLRPGIEHELRFRVTEAPEFQLMPQVFAIGFLIGLLEWTWHSARESPHRLAAGADRGQACECESRGGDTIRS